MGAFTGLDDLIDKGYNGTHETISFFKSSCIGSTEVGGTNLGNMLSLWQWEGFPSAGALPGTSANPTNATAGALGQIDATGGRAKYLTGWAATATGNGTLILVDRLLHMSDKVGNTTGAQTITGGTITRNTGGRGNGLFTEIFTAIGASASAITASYSNTVPTSGRTSLSVSMVGDGNTGAVTRAVPLPLASGDLGVTAVASLTLSASTGTVGAIGLVIARPLAILPMYGSNGNGYGVMNYASGFMPTIDAGACLALYWLSPGTQSSSTNPFLIQGTMNFIEA